MAGRAERMSSIEPGPVEAKVTRSEAANDNDNVIDLTDVVVEKKKKTTYEDAAKKLGIVTVKEKKARQEARSAEYRTRFAAKQKQKTAPVEEVQSDDMGEVLSSLQAIRNEKLRPRKRDTVREEVPSKKTELPDLDIPVDVRMEPPKPTAEQLKKSREQKKESDLAKAKAKAKEIFDKMDTLPEKDLVVTELSDAPLTDAEVATLTPKQERNRPITDADLKRGYRGKDRKEKGSGIGLSEKEWFGQSEDMGKSKNQESPVEKRVRTVRERRYDAKTKKQQAEEKASVEEPAKPSFWQKLKGIFSRSKEPKLDDFIEPVAVDSAKPAQKEVVASSAAEQKESNLTPVSMSAILDRWNKDYAKRGVRLILDKMPNDGRDMVTTSINDIVGRLEQRLHMQLRKNNVSGYEYNTNIKPLIEDLATTLVQKGERELEYRQRSYPKFPKKAA